MIWARSCYIAMALILRMYGITPLVDFALSNYCLIESSIFINGRDSDHCIFIWHVKNTGLSLMIFGVGNCVCVCVCAQSWLTLGDPMDCNLPDYSAHGTFQARMLEWVAISYSRAPSRLVAWRHILGKVWEGPEHRACRSARCIPLPAQWCTN